MPQLIPSYTYHFTLDLPVDEDSIPMMIEALQKKGGRLLSFNQTTVVEIPASSFASALTFHSELIHLSFHKLNNNSVMVKVFRKSEEKFGKVVCLIVIAFSVLIFFQKQDLKAIFLPFVFYGLFWAHSFFVFHPGHRNLRKFLQNLVE